MKQRGIVVELKVGDGASPFQRRKIIDQEENMQRFFLPHPDTADSLHTKLFTMLEEEVRYTHAIRCCKQGCELVGNWRELFARLLARPKLIDGNDGGYAE